MREVVVGVVALGLLVSSIAGCKSSSPAGGPDGGLGFTVQETIFIEYQNEVFVYLSDRTGLCGVLNGGAFAKSATILSLYLANLTSPTSSSPIVPGTYAVVTAPPTDGGLYSAADLSVSDSNCAGTFSSANGGSVVVSSVALGDGGHATGSFALTFGQTPIQGTYDANFCLYAPPPDAGVLPDGGTDCL